MPRGRAGGRQRAVQAPTGAPHRTLPLPPAAPPSSPGLRRPHRVSRGQAPPCGAAQRGEGRPWQSTVAREGAAPRPRAPCAGRMAAWRGPSAGATPARPAARGSCCASCARGTECPRHFQPGHARIAGPASGPHLRPPAPRAAQACYAAPLDACIAEQCVLGGVGVVGSAGDDALASSQDDGTAAGSLCCEETRDSLEDCSSLDAEEGFVVYQSPLSLGPEGQGQGDGGDDAAGGDGGGPGPGVLGDCGPVPLLAGDPDLEEMLRWVLGWGPVFLAGAPQTGSRSNAAAQSGVVGATAGAAGTRLRLPACPPPSRRPPSPPPRSVLFDAESELQPSATYLEQHGPCCAAPDLYLDASMRRIIAGWLVEVAWEFKLHQETLFLSTALLDRFLSVSKVRPRRHGGKAGGGARRPRPRAARQRLSPARAPPCPRASAERAAPAAADGGRGVHADCGQARGGAFERPPPPFEL